MTVYVGVPMYPFHNMVMCHMFASSNAELDEMAEKIGLRPEWKQKPRDSIGPHYDIARSKRALAIQHGATACDTIEEEAAALDAVDKERNG